jgi:gliding motility-associated-like protein
MEYEGADLSLEEENLIVKTSLQTITELKPYAYQLINGRQVSVACQFQIRGNVVSYVFPDGYDECEELVIDPILIFSAYSGSTQDNWGNTATYDDRGNLYSGGMVSTKNPPTGFPVTVGAFQITFQGGNWDVGILKYDSAGSKLLYATYLGGNNTETPQSLVVNAAGELLILGATGSSDFPVTNGSTFKGGTPIDPLGGVPFTAGSDIFIAKLSEDGAQLLGGTYLGGSENDGINFISGVMSNNTKVESPLARNYGDQLRGDIITDENNEVYIASNTLSDDFPLLNSDATNHFNGGSHDAIIVKLASDLSSLRWSRFVGGSGTDAAYSIKIDSDKIFVAGGSNSANLTFPAGLRKTLNGGIDGWVASISRNGDKVLAGTFLGTAQYDQAYFIDLTKEGEVLAFGQTRGQYPVVGNVYRNENAGQFLHKLTNDLSTTIYSTVIGSSPNAGSSINPNISPTAFLVNDCNNLFISGWGGNVNATNVTINANTNPVIITRNYVGGNTQGMPTSPDAFQGTTQGSDFYFMVLSADASSFIYGTYLGGNTSSTHVDGGTSRFDKRGIVYHAVCAGCGGNTDFPAVNVPPAHQLNRSQNCNNAAFKFDLSSLRARLQSNNVKLNNPGMNQVCIPDTIVFQNLSVGGRIYEWTLGDGTFITKFDKTSLTHQYKKEGRYLVKLKAIDEGTCQVVDSTSFVVSVFKKNITVQDDDELCENSSYQLKASGGSQYHWTSEDGSFSSFAANPVIAPIDTTKYYVSITDINGCSIKDSVTISVIPKIVPEFALHRDNACEGIPKISFENLTDSLESTDEIFVDFGDGNGLIKDPVIHEFYKEGNYNIRLTAVRHGCPYTVSEQLPVFALKLPNVITPAEEGLNDHLVIQYGSKEGVTPLNYDYKTSLNVYDRWGKLVYENENYQFDWSGAGLASGVYYYEVTVEKHATCKSWIQVIR